MHRNAKHVLTLALAFLFGAAAATAALRLGPSPSANAPVAQPPVNSPVTAAPSDLVRHADPGIGLSFSYVAGPDGYVLEELPPAEADRTAFVKTFILMRTDDRRELMRSDEGREGPPTMSVMVFRNPDGLDAASWIRSESASGYVYGATAPIDTAVGGEHAVAYEGDGLYRTDNAVVARGGLTYVFSASWSDASSRIRADFADMLRTIEFK
jgi:hypothetical protein